MGLWKTHRKSTDGTCSMDRGRWRTWSSLVLCDWIFDVPSDLVGGQKWWMRCVTSRLAWIFQM